MFLIFIVYPKVNYTLFIHVPSAYLIVKYKIIVKTELKYFNKVSLK